MTVRGKITFHNIFINPDFLSCLPSSERFFEIFVIVGTVFNAISLICGRINNLTDTTVTAEIGSDGGDSFAYACPYPSVAVGFNYRGDTYVKYIQLICYGKSSVIAIIKRSVKSKKRNLFRC